MVTIYQMRQLLIFEAHSEQAAQWYKAEDVKFKVKEGGGNKARQKAAALVTLKRDDGLQTRNRAKSQGAGLYERFISAPIQTLNLLPSALDHYV